MPRCQHKVGPQPISNWQHTTREGGPSEGPPRKIYVTLDSARFQPTPEDETVDVPHRSLDHPAPIAGGVDDISPTCINSHVGYDSASPLFEVHQIAGAKVALSFDPVSVLRLLDRVVGQPPVELPEDNLGVTGAILSPHRPAWSRTGSDILSADVPPGHLNDSLAAGASASTRP